MNVLTGTLKRSNGSAWVETDDRQRLPLAVVRRRRRGQKVAYGVRPEHFALSDAPEALAANVEVVEQTASTFCVRALRRRPALQPVPANATSSPPGQPIRLMPQLSAVHLFDAQSGSGSGGVTIRDNALRDARRQVVARSFDRRLRCSLRNAVTISSGR